VISCGRSNDYGHPTPSTLAALRASPGLSLYRTDEDGRVVVDSDGRAIAVRTQR
jgi:beta-lactamase superfamily II metal-dependent hydrolase